MEIVRALPGDAEALARLHRASVLAFGAASYGPEVLDRWSPPVTENRIAFYRHLIDHAPDGIWTARAADGTLLGFAAADPGVAMVTLVYVAPDAGRRGIGKALLAFVEERARTAGCTALSLVGSANAAGFYASQGWREVYRDHKHLAEDVAMEVVHMEKAL